MNIQLFLVNFIIIFLQVLIVTMLLNKSKEGKKSKEISDVEIQIKYMALHYFKEYMNNYLDQIDKKELENYLVDSILLDTEFSEEEVRCTIRPFIDTLIDGMRF